MIKHDIRPKHPQPRLAPIKRFGKRQITSEDMGMNLDSFCVRDMSCLARILEDDRAVTIAVIFVWKALMDRTSAEQVGDRECDTDSTVSTTVPTLHDIHRVGNRVIIGELAGGPCPMLGITARPRSRDM